MAAEIVNPRTGNSDGSTGQEGGGEPLNSLDSFDPAFALQSLADTLPSHAEVLARSLGDALETVPAVGNRALTRVEAAEMFLRIAYSHYLVPHREPEELLRILRGFAGLPPRRLART